MPTIIEGAELKEVAAITCKVNIAVLSTGKPPGFSPQNSLSGGFSSSEPDRRAWEVVSGVALTCFGAI
jgi:hypothetical protein